MADRTLLENSVTTGKDLVALLRDAALLLMALLLIASPQTFNDILVRAGFEEGSLVGLRWKAKLSQSDSALLEAQATIADLKKQNEELLAALADAKTQIGSGETRGEISRLEDVNKQVITASEQVQGSVQQVLSANAPLLQRLQAQSALPAAQEWGVVFGGDTSLALAQDEVRKAERLGLSGALIYLRQGSYRSVAVVPDRVQADRILGSVRKQRGDAYVVDLGKWCPQPGQRSGYLECGDA